MSPKEARPAICICMGSSCFARGNGKNAETIFQYLEQHGLTAAVELTGLLCTDACSGGPNLEICGHPYRGVEPAALPTILDHHFGEVEKDGKSS